MMLDSVNRSDDLEPSSESSIVSMDGEPTWSEVDAALKRIALRRGRLDVEEARWLVAAAATSVHLQVGCGSLLEYIERVLGYSPRMARERLRVAEALIRHQALNDAVLHGDLSFTAVRELTRVIRDDTLDAWIDASLGKSLREIETMVSGRKPGDLPTTEPDPALEQRTLRLELPAAVYAMFCDARRELSDRVGHHVEDAELIEAMARSLLDDTDRGTDRPAYQVSITTCDHCKRGWQDGGNRTFELSRADVATATCDADEICSAEGEKPGVITRGIPLRIRRAVTRRDHNRCVVPWCRSTRNLDTHHIKHREDGGDDSIENLCLLCAGHHRAHHRGLLEVERSTSGDLVVRRVADMPPDAQTSTPRVPGSVAIAEENNQLARSALVASGFKSHEAWVGVTRARTHVGRDAPLEVLVRESFRAMASTRGGDPRGSG